MSAEGWDDVLAQSRRALSLGSKSFAAAARLLGRREREGATLMYAWCRHCDDIIDGQTLGHGRDQLAGEPVARLSELAVKTRSALRGAPVEEAPFVALQRVVRSHEMPPRFPVELLKGFAMDVENRRYASLEEVLHYCYHVAGVVGIMMAYIMGVRDERGLDRACDLGIAFQLTNIARDVLDDAALGRIYLPLDWLDAELVPPSEIAAIRHRPAVARVVGRLLDVANDYYASADIGIQSLSLRSAWSIAVARGIYSDIGKLVRRQGVKAWDRRAVVSKPRKLAWVARGAGRALRDRALVRSAVSSSREHLWVRPREWRWSLAPSGRPRGAAAVKDRDQPNV